MSGKTGIIVAVVAVLAAGAIGFQVGSRGSEIHGPTVPDEWVARVGEHFITRAEFEEEMQRRGGARPGQFHDIEQRQALLDELIFQRAMVSRAEAAGLHRQPVVRRSLDQIVINQLIQSELRPRQEGSDIDPAEIEAFFAEHADDYTIPARRRVAMLQFEVGAQASEQTRREAYDRAQQARNLTLELASAMPDFGRVAQEFSDHQASRFRGGVLGWVSEGEPSRYSHPAVVLEAVNDMTLRGEVSGVLENGQGFYLVRLVDYEPRRTRTLDELRSGITQRLMRDRFNEVEATFRAEVLAETDVEIRTRLLEKLAPTGPPAPTHTRPEPPPIPGIEQQES